MPQAHSAIGYCEDLTTQWTLCQVPISSDPHPLDTRLQVSTIPVTQTIMCQRTNYLTTGTV